MVYLSIDQIFRKFQIRKIDCNNDIIRRVKAEFGTRCFGQHVRIDGIALHQANALCQKLLMSLQQFQLFLGKDDFPVQLRTRENAAITGDDMETEKQDQRGGQQKTASHENQPLPCDIHPCAPVKG